MLDEQKTVRGPATVGADIRLRHARLIAECCAMNIVPHVAQSINEHRGSAIDQMLCILSLAHHQSWILLFAVLDEFADDPLAVDGDCAKKFPSLSAPPLDAVLTRTPAGR